MNWDTCQREMLAALGHTLYVPVSADAPAMPFEEKTGAPKPAQRVREPNASGPRNPERKARPRIATSPEALMHALLRAANLGERDARLLQSQLPPVDTLAGNAAAKRKCWPTLRALRAQRPT